jgi:hypothetical protein
MDQELYMFGCTLCILTKNSSRIRRLSWMDGSDSDDEDQHSWSPVQDEAEIQPWSASLVFVL